MLIKALQFAAILCTAIAMAGGAAHLLELPAKMKLSRENYLAVQQIYRGWALLGIAVLAALASTSVLAAMLRDVGMPFWFALASALSIALSLIVFFTVTFPVNRATQNWTVLPEHWEDLRKQWEYSHAAGALLYFAALAALCLSVLSIT